MKVLHILRNRWVGGAERIVGWLARGLPTNGFELFVACPPGSWLENDLADTEATVVPEGMRGIPGVRSLFAHRRLVHQVQQHQIDVIHTHLRVDSFYGAWVAKTCRIPFVRTLHLKGDADSTIFNADLITPVSQALTDHLITLGVPKERIRVCRAGIDLDRFKPFSQLDREHARARLGLDSRPVVGMVSRLKPVKGVEILLQAVAQNSNLQALIVGYGKPAYEAALHTLASELEIRDRVLFTGKQDDVRPFLAAIDVQVLPSQDEGLPISLLEAMACGIPVIATPAGGTPEVVQHQETGLLIPYNDPQALSDAIRLMLQDTKRSNFCISNALELIHAEYGIPQMVSRVEKIYQELHSTRKLTG